jgi:hypothetical protein
MATRDPFSNTEADVLRAKLNFSRLLMVLVFIFGCALGFGFGNRYARAGRTFQDGMRNPSPGAEVPLPSYAR